MSDQLDLFAAPPADPPAQRIPTAAQVVASGLTPQQWFCRRYPRVRNVRGVVEMEAVRDGYAAPSTRALFDNWYLLHYGEPVDFPLPGKEHLHNPPTQANNTTHAPAGAVER